MKSVKFRQFEDCMECPFSQILNYCMGEGDRLFLQYCYQEVTFTVKAGLAAMRFPSESYPMMNH